MRRTTVGSVAFLFVVAALLAACSSDCGCPSPCARPCPSPCASPCAPPGGAAYRTYPAPSAYGTPSYGAPAAPAQPSGGATAPAQGGNVVTVQGHAYTPATLTVRAGTTVRWVNRDNVAHSATGDGFDVEIPAGGEGSHTFSTAGTFDVTCRYHATMRGKVIVQ